MRFDITEQMINEALTMSVIKWRRTVEIIQNGSDDYPISWESCPLCMFFHPLANELSLERGCDDRCPIKAHSGLDLCDNTPYDAFCDDGHEPTAKDAQAMVDFLQMLKTRQTSVAKIQSSQPHKRAA